MILKDFIAKTDSGYLFSFGNCLANKDGKKTRIKGNYVKQFSKFFNKEHFKETIKTFNLNHIVMDSGGYQAQSGYLTVPECYEFIDEYKQFIEEQHSNFRNFFALDLIPDGLSASEILKLNDTSYSNLASLPEEARKKVIFVYHFFTPKVYETWKTITAKYFDKFSDYFAFGGLAAKDTTGVRLPIAVFAIGIVQIVHEAKMRGMKKIKIHILGAASYRDIMLYQLYKVIIKKFHDIDLDITYDSSLVFKQIQKSRCINILEEDYTNNLLCIKETNLKKKINRMVNGVDTYTTVEDILREKFANMLECIDPMYRQLGEMMHIYEMKSDGTGTSLGATFSFLTILFSGWQYNELEKKSYKYIDSLMPILDSDPYEFYDVLSDVLLKLNAGKLSFKFKDKIKYIRSTVECLINLDTKYIDTVVNDFLAQAEIVDTIVSDVEIPTMDF